MDGLTFTVRPGHVTGFLGPNGAGKSTTMRMILGLDAPPRGTVTVNGKPVRRDFAARCTRSAPCSRSAPSTADAAPTTTCFAWPRATASPPAGQRGARPGRARAASAASRAGKFSLGMSQRLGLAAALLGDPPVLICDEPVNGLDPEGILWIRTLLRALAAEGRTVFVSSHLMSEMALTADHLIVIGQGKLLADASTADIIAASSRSYVLVRSPSPTDWPTSAQPPAPRVTTASPDGSAMTDEPSLHVTGIDHDAIGDIAARARHRHPRTHPAQRLTGGRLHGTDPQPPRLPHRRQPT